MSPKSLYNPIRTSDMMRRRRADGTAAHDAVADGAAEAHGGAVDAAGAEQMAAGAEQMDGGSWRGRSRWQLGR